MTIPTDLEQGYRRFRHERLPGEAGRYKALALGQEPKVMVIACADSRVDPATIFSAAPGELFVVRNVAALVPPYEEGGTYHGTSAAIEFAVTVLGVERIVVMGHGLCGGVAAALASATAPVKGRFIGPWVALLAETRDQLLEHGGEMAPEARQQAMEHLAIKHSIANLATFPFVAEAVQQGRLALDGAWFSIAKAELHWLDPDSGAFETVAPGQRTTRPVVEAAE